MLPRCCGGGARSAHCAADVVGSAKEVLLLVAAVWQSHVQRLARLCVGEADRNASRLAVEEIAE